jgi:hypothetical protein
VRLRVEVSALGFSQAALPSTILAEESTSIIPTQTSIPLIPKPPSPLPADRNKTVEMI